MIKNRFFLLLFLIVLFIVSINIVPSFKREVLRFSNTIKLLFLTYKDSVEETIQKHFNQKRKIEELQKRVDTLKPYALMAINYQKELSQLLNETNLNYHHPSLFLVRALSFQKISNYTRLWVDFKDFNKSKIYGLIYKGYTAGIIKEEEGNPLAILELDPSIAISVYIGPFKTQGVIFGNYKNMIIKYIQKFNSIKIGDEVETSGKDGVFPMGIKIGKVVDIKEHELYNEATVEPYIKPTEAKYFYAIDTHIQLKAKK